MEEQLTKNLGFNFKNILVHRSEFTYVMTSGSNEPVKPTDVKLKLLTFINDAEGQSHLTVDFNFRIKDSDSDVLGYDASYCVLGVFEILEGTDKEQQTIFFEKAVLPILLPYAREYNSEIARRVGFPNAILPIINPQQAVEHMLKNNLITIRDDTVKQL